MTNLNYLINQNPYSFNQNQKKKFFIKFLNRLTLYHYNNSDLYKKILNLLRRKKKSFSRIADIPFIPVRLFKDFDLLSIKKKKIIKIMYSSGTTNNQLSKIYLDKKNASNQIKVLQKIVSNFLGNERLPMLIVDTKQEKIDRKKFGARTAAINGFSIFGRDHTYILKNEKEIDYSRLNSFLKKYNNKKFLVFGFTSLIYENLIRKLKLKFLNYDFKNAILLHGGGWKKLDILKISNNKFKKELFTKLKISNIHNYYGLVEQTGSIYLECKCGYFVASNFSEVLIRGPNFELLKNKQRGFIQLISLLPTSYPGHSIITEDIGETVDETNCKCGLGGKKFLVHGRVEKAEIRGCSDI